MSPDASDLRTNVPHSARMYDYMLGGKDNFAPDRAAVEQLLTVLPSVRDLARENRGFLVRATRYLAAERGIRQFLDIGTGLPTSPNLHEVAQGVAAESRVVYVDNDPLVLVHARALLTGTPEGRTAYIDADLREPGVILEEARLTLDFSRPVAVSLLAILHFLPDAHAAVQTLVDALPSGSALVISHSTEDVNSDEVRRAGEIYTQQGIEVAYRSRDEVLRFFDGLEVVEPGVVLIHDWRPEGGVGPESAPEGIYGVVGIKP